MPVQKAKSNEIRISNFVRKNINFRSPLDANSDPFKDTVTFSRFRLTNIRILKNEMAIDISASNL